MSSVKSNIVIEHGLPDDTDARGYENKSVTIRLIRVICVLFKLNWLILKNHCFFGKRYISSQSDSLTDY